MARARVKGYGELAYICLDCRKVLVLLYPDYVSMPATPTYESENDFQRACHRRESSCSSSTALVIRRPTDAEIEEFYQRMDKD